ncbi:MAG: G5 domain-containing protein, partial [Oscillospiraceae bacterium]|nr:G5 domain-containing protein [Oscillospiraceae bacterium]
VDAERIVAAGAAEGEADAALAGGEKVAIRQNGTERYATGRAGETVSALLRREGVSVGALERVYAERTDEGLVLEIASDFTYYETVAEAAAYTTVYQTDYTLPKGETAVERKGAAGTRDVTYEVIYADGELVSRQAVAEYDSTAVNEVVRTGTLVKEARAGDTIASVVTNADGSGYLLLKSGDSLHFTGSMAVKCTAYSAEQRTVGTRTATGTAVRVGVVAVDRSVIPLGTTMFVTTADGSYTYGMGYAEDTGVRGQNVDLYMNTIYECRQFGRRSSVVYFLDK